MDPSSPEDYSYRKKVKVIRTSEESKTNDEPDSKSTLPEITPQRAEKASLKTVYDYKSIQGLTYIENFLTKQEEDDLFTKIYENKWQNTLKRRVQHYGYIYDYKARSLDSTSYLGELPGFVEFLLKRMESLEFLGHKPDQLIINEYLPGQGIHDHIDNVGSFEDGIISISLGSSIVMDFKNKLDKKEEEIYLKRRSFVCLQKDARYKWTHGIAHRKTDSVQGVKVPRSLRVSLTFRKSRLSKNEV